MTADNIALLNALLTFALVVLTGFYVFLTHRLINHTKEANLENITIQTLQARLAYFPKLTCRIFEKNNHIALTISNPCDHPAYDVEIYAIHNYDQDNIDIPTFSVKYLKNEGRKLRVETTRDGCYGLFDVMFYSDFPGRKKVEVICDTPIIPSCFHVLIQFNDVMGHNYIQTYWFFSNSQDDAPHNFKLGAMNPKIPTPIPKIERDIDCTSRFIMQGGKNIEDYVDREFLELFKSSFPSGYLKNSTHDVEDRGQWYNL